MQETRILMGMPITVVIVDEHATQAEIGKIFEYFRYVDEKFSTYKDTSEIMAINRAELLEKDWSDDMRTVLALCEETKEKSDGYFEIRKPNGSLDPSGLVKGWSIWNASKMLRRDGFKNFYVDAGGDIQPFGKNAQGKPWTVGIRNPFKKLPEKWASGSREGFLSEKPDLSPRDIGISRGENPGSEPKITPRPADSPAKATFQTASQQDEIVKVISLSDEGVATSGTYVRGEHIYDPKLGRAVNEIVSLTVIGPNVYEADRFATAAYAMGARGIRFLEKLKGFEAYMIDKQGIATMTSNFEKYTN